MSGAEYINDGRFPDFETVQVSFFTFTIHDDLDLTREASLLRIPLRRFYRTIMYESAWMVGEDGETTSILNGSGELSNTKKSIFEAMTM
jgi:hypothetical protein